MFSRDSQVFRNRKSFPWEQRNQVQNDSDEQKNDGLKIAPAAEEKIAPIENREEQENKAEQLEAIDLNKQDLNKRNEIERSQSWQVAPNLFSSFRYAWAGISYAFQTQRNFRIHTSVGSLAMVLCWLFKVSNIEVAIVCLTIGAVLVMEILNTALESLVDLTVGQTYHDLAKIAKDCAAGAVLMAAIVALLIAILIFAPPLWAILSPFISSILSI